ncbi:MAG: hypothetical protein IPO36_07115 [Anaerolineales bacterium]|nr:hypothetical protein [Anaerolineales bacterium]
MTNRNVHWGRDYILVQANMTSPFKIGFPNPRGWQAYWLQGTLFVKRAEYNAQAEYYDHGSSVKAIAMTSSLNWKRTPITTVLPGAAATHIEIWNLYKDVKTHKMKKKRKLLQINWD